MNIEYKSIIHNNVNFCKHKKNKHHFILKIKFEMG